MNGQHQVLIVIKHGRFESFLLCSNEQFHLIDEEGVNNTVNDVFALYVVSSVVYNTVRTTPWQVGLIVVYRFRCFT